MEWSGLVGDYQLLIKAIKNSGANTTIETIVQEVKKVRRKNSSGFRRLSLDSV
jgi:hypothetical protein